MLRQYYEQKSQYPGCILLFRLGDFYEMFGDDATLASKLLQITLTSRDAGGDTRIPMCGVPHHSAEKYIAQLVRNGYKVALCEQVEDPKAAKGVVRREVVRVVTPGTVTDEEMLSERENNFLVSLSYKAEAPRSRATHLFPHPSYTIGLAVCDLSTGEFMCTEMGPEGAVGSLKNELTRLSPTEVLLDPAFEDEEAQQLLETIHASVAGLVEVQEPRYFYDESARKRLLSHFHTESLEGFGCERLDVAVRCAGALLEYLTETQKRHLDQISRLSTYSVAEHMQIDAATRRNLELVRTLRDGERRGSLIWVLDRTSTSMGGRLLRRWTLQPLVKAAAIQTRLDAVDDLVQNVDLRFGLRSLFDKVYDVERLVARVASQSANARDLIALKASLRVLPEIQAALANQAKAERLSQLADQIDPCADVCATISQAIVDEPPISITEGGIIRRGYSADVDELALAATSGREWISRLEQEERDRTKIRSLKVGYNKVFGYYIEVTRPNLAQVPAEYQRKQTLANAERFITPELKEQEERILGAHDRLVELEYELFVELRRQIGEAAARIQSAARILAELDVYLALADVAVDRGYVKPVVDEDDALEIRDGRHPVVEATLKDEAFVPNDLHLDGETQVIVLTGPNMAGKSTYLRQTALIVLMAQIGSFVPASAARIGVVDRIFTRVGASDDLATGQSTFMVEMNEVANILNHATPKSLVILDEVGRGTSTFDGLSIAWAVTEYLLKEPRVKAKTLFATHYHELTELEELLPGVKNYSVAVHKEGQEILFLRRIVQGGADQSYGIEVARLAGLPAPVLQRARQILEALESSEERRLAQDAAAATIDDTSGEIAPTTLTEASEGSGRRPAQLALFAPPHPLIERLKATDVERLTPLEALNLLAAFVNEARLGGDAS